MDMTGKTFGGIKNSGGVTIEREYTAQDNPEQRD